MKADPTVAEQMKAHKMYVKGVYEEPEIRTVVPEHLVRCGFTSSYDVKFGHEVGAGAVLLLAEGIQGVTVTNIDAGVVKYMNTEEAIVQRHVNLTEAAMVAETETTEEVSMTVERYYSLVTSLQRPLCAGSFRPPGSVHDVLRGRFLLL
eukprot:s3062_g6.t2